MIALQERVIRTVDLDYYAAAVIMRENKLFTDVKMVALLNEPFLNNKGFLLGQCCSEDGTPYLYRVNTNTARLVDLSLFYGEIEREQHAI